MRTNTKGKGYNRGEVDSGEGNSASADNFMSMDESSNNQNTKKKNKRILPSSQGLRK
jgi:hypothetical protein